MQAAPSPSASFKRQVVFRIGADDWPLLEAAAAQHGSIQAAIIAGLRALAPAPSEPPPAITRVREAKPTVRTPAAAEPDPQPDPNEELRARDAARIVGLQTSTVSGYIRSGRLPGRYDRGPRGRGWLITRRAVSEYLAARDRR